MSEAEEIARARALFEKFHGRAPRADELIKVGGILRGATALKVGVAVGLAYNAGGVEYYHAFEGRRPFLYVDESGRQIFFIGGVYTFTERGFIK